MSSDMSSKIREIVSDIHLENIGFKGLSFVDGEIDRATERITTLIQKERKEAVIEYRINFEKGVQEVVENTVARDRVAEIRKEAVEEWVSWFNQRDISKGVEVLIDFKLIEEYFNEK